MFKTLDMHIDRMIDLLVLYKENEVDSKDKKFWIDMLMSNQQNYPVGEDKYMNRLNSLVRHKFLGEKLININLTTKNKQ